MREREWRRAGDAAIVGPRGHAMAQCCGRPEARCPGFLPGDFAGQWGLRKLRRDRGRPRRGGCLRVRAQVSRVPLPPDPHACRRRAAPARPAAPRGSHAAGAAGGGAHGAAGQVRTGRDREEAQPRLPACSPAAPRRALPRLVPPSCGAAPRPPPRRSGSALICRFCWPAGSVTRWHWRSASHGWPVASSKAQRRPRRWSGACVRPPANRQLRRGCWRVTGAALGRLQTGRARRWPQRRRRRWLTWRPRWAGCAALERSSPGSSWSRPQEPGGQLGLVVTGVLCLGWSPSVRCQRE